MSKPTKAIVAAGHEHTARAAVEVLRSGGNAFDAVIAAHFAACVTEPVLSSLAGGSYLLAHTSQGRMHIYDFFAHTPGARRSSTETEFYPISANFGQTQQEFHIGMGAFAVPGAVRGLFAIHRDLCRMPMRDLIEPAITLARQGVRMNRFQSYILEIVRPIYEASPEAMSVFGKRMDGDADPPGAQSPPGTSTLQSPPATSTLHSPPGTSGQQSPPGTSAQQSPPGTPGLRLVKEGELLQQPALADMLEMLSIEGEDLFYRGEIAAMIDRLSRDRGGHVTRDDMASYRMHYRKPLQTTRGKSTLFLNPPPSSGGSLIAFALHLLEASHAHKRPYGSSAYLTAMARAQELTELARLERMDRSGTLEDMLDPGLLHRFVEQMHEQPRFNRGTTHISILDADGNAASLTTSNGEGCGVMLPGTGIMLNNMLGEEDLHPAGLDRWPTNTRITSMMTPAMARLSGNRLVALGSGGSNRLRTAILQVLVNLIDYNMSLEEAVHAPRLHCEKGHLALEPGFSQTALTPLLGRWPDHRIWDEENLFFGGTHAVLLGPDGFQGCGDPRRGGISLRVDG